MPIPIRRRQVWVRRGSLAEDLGATVQVEQVLASVVRFRSWPDGVGTYQTGVLDFRRHYSLTTYSLSEDDVRAILSR